MTSRGARLLGLGLLLTAGLDCSSDPAPDTTDAGGLDAGIADAGDLDAPVGDVSDATPDKDVPTSCPTMAPFETGSAEGAANPLQVPSGGVRAGRLEASELPENRTGLGEWRPGDYALVNERVAVIIEAARDSSGYNPWGGDAHRRRALRRRPPRRRRGLRRGHHRPRPLHGQHPLGHRAPRRHRRHGRRARSRADARHPLHRRVRARRGPRRLLRDRRRGGLHPPPRRRPRRRERHLRRADPRQLRDQPGSARLLPGQPAAALHPRARLRRRPRPPAPWAGSTRSA